MTPDLELTVPVQAERVLAECVNRGLRVDVERTAEPAVRRWRLSLPNRRGVLQVTDDTGRVRLTVPAGQDGGWASGLARELAGARPA